MPSLHSPAHPSMSSHTSADLPNASGKKIELTAPQLEKWLAHAESSLSQGKHKLTSEKMDADTPNLAIQLLSRFGLQTAQDVIEFLNSPAGKATTAMIEKQLAEMAALEEDIRQSWLAEQRQEKRVLIFLLLGLLHKGKVHAHHLNEEIQRAMDKRHQTEEKEAIQKAASFVDSNQDELQATLAAYTEASDAIEGLLGKKLHESKALERDLANIEQLTVLADKKYAHYNSHLDAAHQEIAQWALLPTMPIATIHEKISALTAKVTEDAEEISRHLDAGEDDVAREKMEISNAHNLHIATLHDMLAVIKGEKFLYTEDGIRTENFNEAHFILSQEKKIVLKNDKYYLLNADQNSENLSSEEKEVGEKAYLQLKPEIMGVKQLVLHNQNLEQKEHKEKKSVLSARSEVMQQEISLLANQLTQMQAARANAEALLTPASPAPAMKPMPTATVSPRVVATSTPCLSQSYRHMLLLMKSNPTERAIDWLKTSMANTKNPELTAQLNKLVPGKPIPAELMARLLARRDLGSLWLTTPSNPSIVKPDLTPYTTTAPTPFSTRPKPSGTNG